MNMARVYLIQKWTLVILIVGTSLLFNPFINTDVFEFPKILALLVSVAFLTLINIFDVYRNGLPSFDARKILPELIAVLLLLIGQTIAFVSSTDVQTSLMGAPGRYQGFLTGIHYLLLAANSFYIFSKDKKIAEVVFRWIAVVLFVACMLAILPYVFPLTFPFYFFTPSFFFDRVYGTFGNPNYLSVFIITALPFLVFAKKIRKVLLYPALIIIFITLFLTGSRSAWLACLLAFLVTGIFVAMKNRAYKILIGTLTLVALLFIGAVLKNQIQEVIPQAQRLSLDTEKSTSIQTRLYLWEAGLKMALDRPLQGYGQDMIQENIEPYLPEYLKTNEAFFVDRSHSEFIDIAITTGFLGLVGYLVLILSVLWRSFKKLKHRIELTALGSFTALVALVLFQAVNFSTTSSNVLLYLVMGYLVAFYSQDHNNVPA